MNQSHWTMMDEKDVGELMLNNGKNTSSVSKLPKNGRQDVGVTKDDDFFCYFLNGSSIECGTC